MSRGATLAWAVVALAACNGGGSDADPPPSVEDPAGEAEPGDAPADPYERAEPGEPPVPPPDPPAPPEMGDWACPAGWDRGAVGGAVFCEPPPATHCVRATAQWAGQRECQPVGTACPGPREFLAEDELRRLAPGFDGPIRYVNPRARGRADGSRDAPFRRINDALEQRPRGRGAIIALANIEHFGPVVLRNRVALVGACAQGTVIEPISAPERPVLLTMVADGVRIANLTLTGDLAGVGVVDAADVTLHAVVAEGLTELGVFVVGQASATLSDVVVRSVAPADGATERPTAAGITAGDGAGLTVRRAVVEGGIQGMVFGGQGEPATADLQDVVLRDVGGWAEQGQPVALLVGRGAKVSGRRLLLDQLAGTGMIIESKHAPSPAVAELEDVVLRDHSVPPSGFWTFGGFVAGRASLDLSRAVIRGVQGHGLIVAGPQPGDAPELTLQDAVVSQSALTAALALGADGESHHVGGAGLLVLDRATTTARRVVFDRNERGAVGAYLMAEEGDAPHVELEDLVVIGPDEAAPDREGVGVETAQGASVTVRRARFEGAHMAAVGVGAGLPGRPTRLAGEDVRIVGLRSDVLGRAGGGVVAEGQAEVELERIAVEGAEGAGVAAVLIGETAPGDLAFRHLSVAQVSSPARCQAMTDDKGRCVDPAGGVQVTGVAVAIYGDTNVDLSHFALTGGEQAGLVILGGGRLSARHGTITGNGFGLRLGAGDDEHEPVFDDVFLYDNQTDFARSELAPPNVEQVFARPELSPESRGGDGGEGP